MKIEKLPPIPPPFAPRSGLQRMKEHILAVLLLGTTETAKEIKRELLEIIAVIDNALERARHR